MKTIQALLLALMTLLSTSWAQAHGGGDIQPQHNGLVATANDLVFELATTAEGLALYVSDHGQPLDLQGAMAKVTLLAKGAKQDVVLTPEGDHLMAKGMFSVGSGTKAIAIVELPGKGSQTVRFVAK